MSAPSAIDRDEVTPPAAANQAVAPPLGLGIRIGYGFGSVAFGISAAVLSASVLQLYFNQVIGLPPAWVGFAIALTIFVDSITDPLIGRFSDNLRTPWGRRHVLMYASALPAALGIVLMWHAPEDLGPAGLMAFMIGMLLFVRIATSFYEIPSLALAPELAPAYDERTSLLAWRYLFIYAGAATMNAILYMVYLREDAANPLGVLNRERYADFGLLAAALVFIAIITASLATHGRIRYLHVPPQRTVTWRAWIGELRAILSHRSLRFLMLTTLVNGFGGGLQFALQTYLFLHFWGLKPQDVSYILFVAPLAALVMLWAAPRISARIGKKPFLMACYIGWEISFLAPVVLRFMGYMPDNGSNALIIALTASGFFAVMFGIGFLVMFNSLLADIADDLAVRTGLRSEGVLYAAFGVLDKWGAALGAILAGLLLTWVAFPEKALPGTVDMRIMDQLALIAYPTIAACNVIAMLFVSRLGIDRATHEANLAELQRRAPHPDQHSF